MISLPDNTFSIRVELLLGGNEWLTANHRLFWRLSASRTREWRAHAKLKAKALQVPRIEKAYVIAELRFADSRRRDPSNWAPTAKACVDGLVDAGVFVDDDFQHVVGPDMRIGPKVHKDKRALHLVIYPMEGKQ